MFSKIKEVGSVVYHISSSTWASNWLSWASDFVIATSPLASTCFFLIAHPSQIKLLLSIIIALLSEPSWITVVLYMDRLEHSI